MGMISCEGLVNMVPGGIFSGKIDRGGYQLRYSLERVAGAGFAFATHLDWVKVLLNEKELMPEISGLQLKTINAAKGLFVGDEVSLVLSLIDEAALNAGSLYVGGLDTSMGVSTLVFQGQLNALAPADTRLKLWRDEIPPLRDPESGALIGVREFKHWRKTTVPCPAADLYTIAPEVGPTRAGERVLRLFVFGANIDFVGIRKGGIPVHDDVPQAVNDRDLKDYGMVPQAGLYVADLVRRGDNGEAIDKGTGQTLSYRFKTTGPGNLTVFEEVVTKLTNL